MLPLCVFACPCRYCKDVILGGWNETRVGVLVAGLRTVTPTLRANYNATKLKRQTAREACKHENYQKLLKETKPGTTDEVGSAAGREAWT